MIIVTNAERRGDTEPGVRIIIIIIVRGLQMTESQSATCVGAGPCYLSIPALDNISSFRTGGTIK